ncbi:MULTISPECIES: FAD-binding oxidoreductase [unclassified Haladaptatus]|uniref:NAD(P)/FAD-dependent oxidoreductase n=1 Tax=unclassified Haladaptatus TaxID=2622732 RepID=UPI0023E81AF1|nr:MULTISPECIES: FAD-dependent oxidoreductase [unclassified Haladaptatus]
MTFRVAVAGGGAVGVTTAHDLAVRDADVTLFERDELASGSSGRAAGVCYSHFPNPVDARIARRSLSRFREFAAAREDFEFTSCPYVWFAHESDEERCDRLGEQVERMNATGGDVSRVTPAELEADFPALRAADIGAAARADDAGYTEPATYVRAMGEAAREAGVTIEENAPVRLDDDGNLETPRDAGAFDAVVLTTGVQTKKLLADAGIQIAMKPYRVQALTTEKAAASDEIPMTYDATEGFYFRPRKGGLLVGDGTELFERDPDDYPEDADDEFVETNRQRVARRVAFEPRVSRAWAGMCGATPDYDPLVGEVRDDLFVACGFQGHGFMRSPGIGELLAKQVLGETDFDAFDPTRFRGDEEFEIVEGLS